MTNHLLQVAHALATDAHDGQFDKAGMPYIFHPIRVMERVLATDPYATVAGAAALLHDVVEDTDWILKDIYNELLLNNCELIHVEEVCVIVDKLTKPSKDCSYKDYLHGIRLCDRSTKVKMADMEDNMRSDRLRHLPIEKQLRIRTKYTRGMHFLRTGDWFEADCVDEVIKLPYTK